MMNATRKLEFGIPWFEHGSCDSCVCVCDVEVGISMWNTAKWMIKYDASAEKDCFLHSRV